MTARLWKDLWSAIWLFSWLAPAIAWPSLTLATSLAPWVDPATGLAIGGYDPVTYFTNASPRAGRSEHEANWRGTTWRFVNPGNRQAFVRNPDVYAPQFSGYDPYAVAHGRSTRGHPAIWAIRANRLYLFYSPANRQLWLRDADAITARAEQSWRALARTLPGYSASGG